MGCAFLWLLSFAQAKESNPPQGETAAFDRRISSNSPSGENDVPPREDVIVYNALISA